jgi:hypothetical protein
MFPNNPEGEFFAWLLFSLVLVWALWEGAGEFRQGMENNSDGRDDIHYYPDEVGGEPGPGTSVAAQDEFHPPEGAAGTRIQAR